MDSNKIASGSERGAAIYHGWRLAVYDVWVLRVVNSFAWRCPTQKYLLPLLKNNVRSLHLDVGVGSGWYLDNAKINKDVDITLWDLSPTALEATKTRLNRPVTTRLLDITKPLPEGAEFESISMFFLVHCLPGPMERKLPVFENIKRAMTPDGVLVGATVLGAGVKDNYFGTLVRMFVKWEGIMDNDTDNAKDIERALRQNFREVEVQVIGVVLVFRVSGKK